MQADGGVNKWLIHAQQPRRKKISCKGQFGTGYEVLGPKPCGHSVYVYAYCQFNLNVYSKIYSTECAYVYVIRVNPICVCTYIE